MIPVSVLILTKNEELDLPHCLESLRWCSDIHVLDSMSTDKTRDLANEFGAKVTLRKFDGYARQRNYGLKEIHYLHPWVLILDADERVPEELVSELLLFTRTVAADVVAARLRRRDFWGGRWLKHAQISPYFVRVVRPERVHYEREINERLVIDGAIQELKNHFDHYPFSKGVGHWITKHNLYSRMEAEAISSISNPSFDLYKAFFERDFNLRRAHQKQLFYQIPFRPFLKFIYMFFWRRSFLDGLPGLRYSILQSIYEYFIVLKTQELKKTKGR